MQVHTHSRMRLCAFVKRKRKVIYTAYISINFPRLDLKATAQLYTASFCARHSYAIELDVCTRLRHIPLCAIPFHRFGIADVACYTSHMNRDSKSMIRVYIVSIVRVSQKVSFLDSSETKLLV